MHVRVEHRVGQIVGLKTGKQQQHKQNCIAFYVTVAKCLSPCHQVHHLIMISWLKALVHFRSGLFTFIAAFPNAQDWRVGTLSLDLIYPSRLVCGPDRTRCWLTFLANYAGPDKQAGFETRRQTQILSLSSVFINVPAHLLCSLVGERAGEGMQGRTLAKFLVIQADF